MTTLNREEGQRRECLYIPLRTIMGGVISCQVPKKVGVKDESGQQCFNPPEALPGAFLFENRNKDL